MTVFTRSYYRYPDGELKWTVTIGEVSLSFSMRIGANGVLRGEIQCSISCEGMTGTSWVTDRAMNHYIPNILPLGDDAIWEQLEKDFEDANK